MSATKEPNAGFVSDDDPAYMAAFTNPDTQYGHVDGVTIFQTIFNSIPGIPQQHEQICRLCGKPLTAKCNNGDCDK